MKKFFTFLCALVLVFSLVGKAGATALLVQTNDIWTYNNNTLQPYEAMTQLGISYDKIAHNQLSSTNLSAYDFLFLEGSADDTYYFDTYVDMTQVSNYVQAGGLVVIHYADWNGDYTDIAPGGVDGVHTYIDSADINPAFASDPLFNNVTDDSIDNWNSTAHGYLTNLPAGAEVLITDSSTGNPIYARYPYGNGEVWVTTMTLEWGYADQDLFLNELQLADQYTTGGPNPVPEPSTVLLVGAGLVGLAGYSRKKVTKKA